MQYDFILAVNIALQKCQHSRKNTAIRKPNLSQSHPDVKPSSLTDPVPCSFICILTILSSFRTTHFISLKKKKLKSNKSGLTSTNMIIF